MQWTYSSLDLFDLCPYRYYRQRVVKDVIDPPSEFSEWGQRVHLTIQNYLDTGTELPDWAEKWKPLIARVKALPGKLSTEYRLSIGSDFRATSWETSWSRGVADVLIVSPDSREAAIIDWKTGKRKLTHQLALYAGYVFSTYPTVEKIHTAFAWLKDQKIDTETFSRSQVPEIWQRFLPKVARLEEAHKNNQWPVRPNGLCKSYCPVIDCPHNGRK